MGDITRKRNPERTQRLILEAAVAEFCERGFGGARVDNIAEAAGANKRMIYHYFGNKEALYLAALEEIYAGLRNAEHILDIEDDDPVEAIRKFTLFHWEYYDQHPEFVKMLTTENLMKAKYLKRSNHVRTLKSPLMESLKRIIAQGQQTGVFRDDLDAFNLYLTIAGISYFYFSNAYTFGFVFNRDIMAEHEKADRRQHVVNVIISYVTDKASTDSTALS